MTISEYSEPLVVMIDELSFEHEGRIYKSTCGFLSWDPSEGFNVQAKVKIVSGKNPSLFAPRVGPEPVVSVRIEMVLPGKIVAIAEEAWIDDLSLFLGDKLIANADKIIFETPGVESSMPSKWRGRAIYMFPSETVLPQVNPRTTVLQSIGIQQIEYLRTVKHSKIEEGAFEGVLKRKGEIEVLFALPKSCWQEQEAWDWTRAMYWAFCLIYGWTTPLLGRELIKCNGIVKSELRKRLKPRPIWFLPALPELNRQGEFLWILTKFFVKHGYQSMVCRNVVSQMIEAASQSTYLATELLLATILEAMLRQVYNIPFIQGKRNFNLEEKLKEFISQYLNDDWTKVCKSALKVVKRLRHRNAHPDWMWTDPSVQPWTLPAKRLSDLNFLARFYRSLVFAFAGLKTVELDYLSRYD